MFLASRLGNSGRKDDGIQTKDRFGFHQNLHPEPDGFLSHKNSGGSYYKPSMSFFLTPAQLHNPGWRISKDSLKFAASPKTGKAVQRRQGGFSFHNFNTLSASTKRVKFSKSYYRGETATFDPH